MKRTSASVSEVVPADTACRSDENYADGAWRAWSTVLGAWLLQFCVVGYISAFGVMQTYYSKDMLANQSASAISWIGTVELLLNLSLAVVAGPLLDRGYFRHCVISGSLLFSFCLFMLSLAQSHQYYQFFLSQGLGMGIGAGLVYLPTSAIVAKHMKRRKAFAMGLVTSGGSLGTVVFSIALNYLLNGSLTFGWAIRVTAFVVTGLLLLGNLIMFEPPASSSMPTQQTNEREIAQANPTSIEPEKEPVVDVSPPAVDTGKSEVLPDANLHASFWDGRYICVLLFGFVFGLGQWFPAYYVQLYAEQHGIDKQLSFYALAILNIANMVGRILPNWIGDRWGMLEVYIPCSFAAGAIQFAMFGCSTPYGLALFTIFFGFFFGANISMYLPVIAFISRDGINVGKRMGIALFPVGIASLIGNPINGAILGNNYVWWKGITFAGTTMLAAGVFLISVRLSQLRTVRARSEP